MCFYMYVSNLQGNAVEGRKSHRLPTSGLDYYFKIISGVYACGFYVKDLPKLKKSVWQTSNFCITLPGT